MGEDEWIGMLLPTPALTMAGLARVRLPPPTVHLLAVAKVLPPLEPQLQRLKVLTEVHKVGRNLVPLQCFRCQGWGHMAWECATPAKSLNPVGGTEGTWPNPPLALATTANSRHPAFPPLP